MNNTVSKISTCHSELEAQKEGGRDVLDYCEFGNGRFLSRGALCDRRCVALLQKARFASVLTEICHERRMR